MAQCIFKVEEYHIVGEFLIIRTSNGYKKLYLPFQGKSKDGDFLFYKAINSVIPNPLKSISDILPKNKLETLAEFASYPGC